MSGQIFQYKAYIAGIEIPIISVAISTSENSIWVANITCAWSPFLTKLPKNTKITVFRRNTDLFKDFRLACDGCLSGISESTAWKGQASLTLHLTSDTSILGWRRKQIIDLEFSLTSAALGDKLKSGDNETVVTGLQNILPTEMSMFAPRELVNGDACKAAAYFMSGTPTDNSPGGKKFHDNGYIVSSESSLDKYDYLSPFITRFYQTFKMARKICHVPLPKVWIDTIAGQQSWDMFTDNIRNAGGMVTYWELGRYIVNWFQGAIISIPDATYLGPAVGTSEIAKQPIPKSIQPKPPDASEGPQPFAVGSQGNALAELVIMPHNYFGNAPLCNIIFPDQILSRHIVINHGFEYTRSGIIGQSIPENTETQESGLMSWNYLAPTGLTEYFDSFNLTEKTPAGKRSIYEQEFGISYLSTSLPEAMVRLWLPKPKTDGGQNTTKKNPVPIQISNTMNHEFMIAYSQKFVTDVEVTPDVEVVPGSSVILLNENGEHQIAYCKGTTSTWSIEGQASITLQLAYPHHYSWSFEGALHYGNAFTGAESNLSEIYSALIGSKVDPMITNKILAIKYFGLWNKQYNRDSRQMKYHNKETHILRDVCTMQEYVTFMGGDWNEVKYSFEYDATFTTLGKTLVKLFDSSKAMADMSCAKYSYYDPFTDTVIDSISYQPPFGALGQPGKLTPSTYISGIVDCHLKWLNNVGHMMSV